MADTHINAYFAEVQEAEQEVIAAQAKLDAANIALEAKKKEIGWKDPSSSNDKEIRSEADNKGAGGFGFKKKKRETIDENSL